MTAKTKRGSKTKGRRFELQVARECEQAFPGAQVYRESQAGGATGTPDVAVENWLHLECKNKDTPSWLAALRQAERDAEGTGRHALAVINDARCRERGRPCVGVVMTIDTWNEIRRQMRANGLLDPYKMPLVWTDKRRRPQWRVAVTEGGAVLHCSSTNPVVMACRWDWFRDYMLAPIWAVAGRGVG